MTRFDYACILLVFFIRLILIRFEIRMPSYVVAVSQNVITIVGQKTLAHGAQRENRILFCPLEQ